MTILKLEGRRLDQKYIQFFFYIYRKDTLTFEFDEKNKRSDVFFK